MMSLLNSREEIAIQNQVSSMIQRMMTSSLQKVSHFSLEII